MQRVDDCNTFAVQPPAPYPPRIRAMHTSLATAVPAHRHLHGNLKVYLDRAALRRTPGLPLPPIPVKLQTREPTALPLVSAIRDSPITDYTAAVSTGDATGMASDDEEPAIDHVYPPSVATARFVLDKQIDAPKEVLKKNDQDILIFARIDRPTLHAFKKAIKIHIEHKFESDKTFHEQQDVAEAAYKTLKILHPELGQYKDNWLSKYLVFHAIKNMRGRQAHAQAKDAEPGSSKARKGKEVRIQEPNGKTVELEPMAQDGKRRSERLNKADA